MKKSRRRFLQQSIAVGAVAALALREDWMERLQAAQQVAGGRSPDALAGDEDFWFQVQRAYTVDRSMINLNNGGVSPTSRFAQDAMRRHLEHSSNAPTRTMWGHLDPEVETVRARLARLFGCDAEEMAITRNASESLEICIHGIDLKPGDEVLTTDQDYPRMINTYKQREKREGIVLKTVPVPTPCNHPAELVEIFRQGITPKTRVILCCHMINLTGQIFPVRDIVRLGRERGLPVIVDGAHTFAHFPFKRDELECDYFGTSLHKWLTAPHGTGFLFVRKDKIESLWPLMAAPVEKAGDIRKFEEIGTHPAANRLAISESITVHNGIGPERKAARLRYLRNRWANRLMQDKRVKLFARLEPEHTCGISTMSIDGIDPTALGSYLWNEHRIITTSIGHKDVKGLRISPNVYTTPDEVDMFSDAVENVLANGLPA